MTYISHVKDIKISDLKAKLSAVLAMVRKGESFRVLDRDKPTAMINPLSTSPFEIVSAKSKFKLPISRNVTCTVDPVEILIEERQKR